MSRKPEQMSLFAEKIVSVRWVCEELKMSQSNVLRYLEEGLLRGYQLRPGGWWRVLHDSVVDFKKQAENHPALTRKGAK
jgi:hypothetical protein